MKPDLLLAAIARGMTPVVLEYVAKSHHELAAQIQQLHLAERTIGDLMKAAADLKARVDYLEARPQVRYRKGYRPGDACEPGQMVTHKGAVWHCNEATTTTPGESHDWTLACKGGRDGKDAGGRS